MASLFGPKAGADATPGLARLEEFLTAHPKVKTLAVQAVSLGNVNMSYFITTARARELATAGSSRGGGLRLANNLQRIFDVAGPVTDHVMDVRDDLWVPDWSTLRPCRSKPEQGFVFAWIYTHGNVSEEGSAHDPRAALRRMERAASDMGLEVKVGLELEFYFAKDWKAEEPIDYGALPFMSSTGNRHPLRDIILEIVQELEDNGIQVYAFHTEGGTGSWEIALYPYSPLQAVDNAVFAHETIKEVTYKHGLFVTFHPQAWADHVFATAAQQIHLSINGPTAEAQSDAFLAGLLKHLQAHTALLYGGYDSYRGGRNAWLGANVLAYSKGKYAPIRRFEPNHFEFRQADALGNTYLQVATAIASGLQGIRQQMPLTMKSLDFGSFGGAGDGMGSKPPQALLDSKGVTEMVPTTLAAALDALDRDLERPDGMSALAGKEVVRLYADFKRDEVKYQSAMDDTVRRQTVARHI